MLLKSLHLNIGRSPSSLYISRGHDVDDIHKLPSVLETTEAREWHRTGLSRPRSGVPDASTRTAYNSTGRHNGVDVSHPTPISCQSRTGAQRDDLPTLRPLYKSSVQHWAPNSDPHCRSRHPQSRRSPDPWGSPCIAALMTCSI